MTLVRLVLLIPMLLLSSCDGVAGGGGSVHIAPVSIKYGEPAVLRYELSVWGAGSGKVSNRYTEIKCHYKAEKASAYTILAGTIDSESSDRIVVLFTVPSLAMSDGAYVEYFFDEKLDGHYNKRDTQRVVLQ